MHDKRTAWGRFFKICFILLPAMLLVLCMPVSEFEDTRRIREFYLEEPHSLDVVLLGASDVYAGFSPVLAYEEFGFTSYNYVLSGNFIDLFFGQLEAIQETQSPDWIVIEITEAVNVGKGTDYDPIFRQYLAGVPNSPAKNRMIRQLGNPSQLLSYYFPFFTDHSSVDIKTVLSNAYSSHMTRKRGFSLLKGSISFTGSGEHWDGPYVTPINTASDLSTAPIPALVEENFHTLLTHCKENGIDNLLFVNFPHRLTDQERYVRYQYTNAVGKLIESYGYAFINLESLLDEIGILPETDFYNNDHMNLYGQYKITRYLSRVLTEKYGIQGRKLSAESSAKWETCVEYRRVYESIFNHAFKTRKPGEFGMWMKEDLDFIPLLEEAKQQGCYPLKN